MEIRPNGSYSRAFRSPAVATSSPAENPCPFSCWGGTEIGPMKAHLAPDRGGGSTAGEVVPPSSTKWGGLAWEGLSCTRAALRTQWL